METADREKPEKISENQHIISIESNRRIQKPTKDNQKKKWFWSCGSGFLIAILWGFLGGWLSTLMIKVGVFFILTQVARYN